MFNKSPACALEWMDLGHQTFYREWPQESISKPSAREMRQQRREPQLCRAKRERLCQGMSHRHNTNVNIGCHDHTHPHLACRHMLAPYQSVESHIQSTNGRRLKWDSQGSCARDERVSVQKIQCGLSLLPGPLLARAGSRSLQACLSLHTSSGWVQFGLLPCLSLPPSTV